MAAVMQLMSSAIVHRGPDANGFWTDETTGIALAHRRLSIIDLSPAGAQPMLSPSGRYVLVFNGEIYNHLQLRSQLEEQGGCWDWRGHSDTETLLAAVEAWGIEGALRRCVGMFAFGLWDKKSQSLSLARDRLGEKPLYYGWQNGVLLFSSELKSIAAHPAFEKKLNGAAIDLLLRHNYIPAPYSIWDGIYKLAAAQFITLSRGDRTADPKTYWSFRDIAERSNVERFHGGERDAVAHLDQVLREAVSLQMISDVPVGALLSGGVDSSMIVALMQNQSSRPVKTFSIGFKDARFNEAQHAKKISNFLGTDHTELIMDATDVLSMVPNLPDVFDEPFGDSSQLPTALVMSLAGRHVKVALSGDGGDEVFGGYNRYHVAPKLWHSVKYIPPRLRPLIGRAVRRVPTSWWNKPFFPAALSTRQSLGERMHKFGQRLEVVRSVDDAFLSLVTEWSADDKVTTHTKALYSLLDHPIHWPKVTNPVARMMAVDTLTYLPDDILVKVDRTAMSVSLETRAPFLDHRVVEFAWLMPVSYKIRAGATKIILKKALERYIPRAMFDRPKMGFGLPMDEWLRGPLREWASDLLSVESLKKSAVLSAEPISDMWKAHLGGNLNGGHRLWSVLTLQSWMRRQGL
jgi:asparagine synthase (glutamine-hydrolysing)